MPNRARQEAIRCRWRLNQLLCPISRSALFHIHSIHRGLYSSWRIATLSSAQRSEELHIRTPLDSNRFLTRLSKNSGDGAPNAWRSIRPGVWMPSQAIGGLSSLILTSISTASSGSDSMSMAPEPATVPNFAICAVPYSFDSSRALFELADRNAVQRAAKRGTSHPHATRLQSLPYGRGSV